MLTIAISLLFAVLAGCAILSIIASVRNGVVRGKAIMAELALLEAGRRPAQAQRIVRLRPRQKMAAVRRPLPAPLHWQPGVAA